MGLSQSTAVADGNVVTIVFGHKTTYWTHFDLLMPLEEKSGHCRDELLWGI